MSDEALDLFLARAMAATPLLLPVAAVGLAFELMDASKVLAISVVVAACSAFLRWVIVEPLADEAVEWFERWVAKKLRQVS
ncbi:MAG: hypothetical protein ACPGNP_12755 [Acidimicrobiales bacterium]